MIFISSFQFSSDGSYKFVFVVSNLRLVDANIFFPFK